MSRLIHPMKCHLNLNILQKVWWSDVKTIEQKHTYGNAVVPCIPADTHTPGVSQHGNLAGVQGSFAQSNKQVTQSKPFPVIFELAEDMERWLTSKVDWNSLQIDLFCICFDLGHGAELVNATRLKNLK